MKDSSIPAATSGIYQSRANARGAEILRKNVSVNTHRTFLGYALAMIRETGAYTAWKSALAYLRRARTVALLIKIVSALFVLLQTGTLVLLSTLLTVVLLPLLVLALILAMLISTVKAPMSNRELARALSGKRVYVLFPTKGQNTFLEANASALAAREESAVILCLPLGVMARGGLGKGFFLTYRQELPNVYAVRRSYFFSLKRKVLQKENTVFLY